MWFGEIDNNIIGTNHVTFTSTVIVPRACDLYHDVLDIGSLLTRNLLSEGFLLVKLKTSYHTFCVGHHVLVNHYGISVLCMYIVIGHRWKDRGKSKSLFFKVPSKGSSELDSKMLYFERLQYRTEKLVPYYIHVVQGSVDPPL